MFNMNARQMQHAMKRLGIQQQEIDATEVIIRTAEKEIIIENPQVSKVNMMGQETFQIVGKPIERSLDTTPDINEDDIKTVMEQAEVDEETAKKALQKAKGDIAQAIIDLKGE
jgi:nascent polypeptide-associated complex subunit alpha